MKHSTLLTAALAALTITGFAATANAAPTSDGDYVTRAVRSPNGKDVFVRLVKVPKTQVVAETRDRPVMKACAPMCDHMMGDHHAVPAPKG